MPQNVIRAPIDNLATLLANCSTFQTLTGAIDASAAAAFIHFFEVGPVTDDPRPRIIVGGCEKLSRRKTSSSGWTTSAGTVWFVLQADTPTDYLEDGKGGGQWFTGQLQSLMNDLESLAGTESYLNVIEWTISEDPMEYDEQIEPDETYPEGVRGQFWHVRIDLEVK